jgi:hypothetical protein
MEIKVNSKENPRIFKAIPRIFPGFSPQIKGFPKDAKPRATAKPGVKRMRRHRERSEAIQKNVGAPYVLLDRHAAKARLKRRASLDALWRLAITERPLSFEASDRAGWVNLVRVRSKPLLPLPKGCPNPAFSPLCSAPPRAAATRRSSRGRP